jgi:hypothetical protein
LRCGCNRNRVQRQVFFSFLLQNPNLKPCEDSSLIVAMRTCLYPPPSQDPSYNSMDMHFPLNMPEPSPPESAPSKDWGSWGESSAIELCEVQVQFNYMALCSSTVLLTPLDSSQDLNRFKDKTDTSNRSPRSLPFPPNFHSYYPWGRTRSSAIATRDNFY